MKGFRSRRSSSGLFDQSSHIGKRQDKFQFQFQFPVLGSRSVCRMRVPADPVQAKGGPDDVGVQPLLNT